MLGGRKGFLDSSAHALYRFSRLSGGSLQQVLRLGHYPLKILLQLFARDLACLSHVFFHIASFWVPEYLPSIVGWDIALIASLIASLIARLIAVLPAPIVRPWIVAPPMSKNQASGKGQGYSRDNEQLLHPHSFSTRQLKVS
jgi:hypothetical protein